MAQIRSNIDDVIAYLQKKKAEGYKTVEVIDDTRAMGWFVLDPSITFLINKAEPTVLGIDARSQRYKD